MPFDEIAAHRRSRCSASSRGRRDDDDAAETGGLWALVGNAYFKGQGAALIWHRRLLGVIPVSVARDWLASFQAMEQLAPQNIVPGHGQVCDLANAQRETRDYLDLLLTAIRARIDAGQDPQTTVDTLDQSEFARLANYDDLKGMNANRVDLELEREF